MLVRLFVCVCCILLFFQESVFAQGLALQETSFKERLIEKETIPEVIDKNNKAELRPYYGTPERPISYEQWQSQGNSYPFFYVSNRPTVAEAVFKQKAPCPYAADATAIGGTIESPCDLVSDRPTLRQNLGLESHARMFRVVQAAPEDVQAGDVDDPSYHPAGAADPSQLEWMDKVIMPSSTCCAFTKDEAKGSIMEDDEQPAEEEIPIPAIPQKDDRFMPPPFMEWSPGQRSEPKQPAESQEDQAAEQEEQSDDLEQLKRAAFSNGVESAENNKAGFENEASFEEVRQSFFANKDLRLIIEQASGDYGVSEALILSLIQAESSFRPQAVSPKGAIGLMQIMPKTAAMYGVSKEDLFEPSINIGTGVQHLSYLLWRYNNNIPLALAAYNAGEGRVDKAGGIPDIAETQNYVRKIMNMLKQKQAVVSSL